ncbi:histidine kinase, partial [Micromonospora aurantiaca]|nr:histidine kinase [Micromonospora aurantiaca]
ERGAIARELHDIVAHSVTVMLIGVRGARDVLETEPQVAARTLEQVETSAEQSLAELRRILVLLRDRQAAETRPQPSLGDLDDLVAGYAAAGLPVRLEIVGE